MLAPFVPYVAKGEIKEEFWQGYPVNPLRGLVQMHQLQRTIKRCLPHIRQPFLLVQGRLDTAIDLRGVDELYRKIGSPVKALHWMENSGHVVILDHELEQVVEITLQFIGQVIDHE